LKEIDSGKRQQCDSLDERYQAQAAEVEEQLKSLRQELQSLKSRNPSDETVEIDVDSLVKENAELQARIDELDRRREELGEMVTANQTDCGFLAQWLKREQGSHADPEAIFKELIQKQCAAREELKKLEESVV
jgi:SMC interacting uncharacterized protein involved in chromosome segregation